MPVNPDDLDKALDAIRRAYGGDNVRFGSQKPELERIPTGSVQLDWATGGGFPLGRWCHLYGGYMSSKTLTCWSVIKNAQAMGKTCIYYNAENQFDPDWVKARGVDLDKLHVVEGAVIEEIGEKMEALMGSAHVHVVDSLAAAVSQDELAGDIGDWNPGLAARAWGKALRRANARFDNKENMVILVNQTRDVFGRGGSEAPTSGRFVEFMSSLSLHFKRSHWLYYDKDKILTPDGNKTDSLTGDTEPVGMEFQVRVAKSRIGPPLRSARLRLDFESGEFDELWPLVKGAKFFGVVKQSGSWFEAPGKNGKSTKVQGEKGLRELIASDPKLAAKIAERIAEDA